MLAPPSTLPLLHHHHLNSLAIALPVPTELHQTPHYPSNNAPCVSYDPSLC